jgi:hypothetical protein
MKWFSVISIFFIVACAQAPQTMATDRLDAGAKKSSVPRSVSPSAPVNLTYRIDGNTVAGQPIKIDIEIITRLTSGTLLVEVAKQEGAATMGETTQRIDLATAPHPIALHMQAVPLGIGEHTLVLLLTVDTPMGPMSRSFRVDLSPASTDSAQ